ncbi:c6 transcription factor [Stemphylium lycopersici]|uniref:C6 transcription factor n=1 Tax=Stemphylium lycopersici TaxID=183478 RepID=A0A364N8Z4_STELY|nr:c6 transcription factor [Stemphylium lycopersici]RAR06328.1 c6 transcription factor [Stemphylium lycopersici]RAR13677.1 c6 transcription factor [Stemphylium lycopersici]
MTTRLRIYEDALRQFGVDPDELIRQECGKLTRGQEQVTGFDGSFDPDVSSKAQTAHVASEAGVLIMEKGKSRYLENGIWTSLRGEFRETREILDESSDEESLSSGSRDSPEVIGIDGTALVMGISSRSTDLQSFHPDPIQVLKLWQVYLDNINPLVKICHVPTVQRLVFNASDSLYALPRDLEALLFAIYCITVQSIGDEQCIAMLGQPRATAIRRFRRGAKQALINANFLKSASFMLLQAFTLFILSLQDYDARVIWIFTGIAQRIGQRIGLHRDGENLGLPPFETELRRRLWWQITILEGHSQKLAGTGTSGMILRGDVRLPLNINDSDLFSGMKEMPKEHEGATEMMFFLIRCYVGDFLKRSAEKHTTFDGLWHRLSTSAVHVATKDREIDELEENFQTKFLRYCDPEVPWHLMCLHLAKAVIFMMRLMAHSSESHNVEMSQAEKDHLFDLALHVSTSQNLAYTMKEMRGFTWHVNFNFQWKAFIYLVSELRYRTEGEKVKSAWAEIEKSYLSHPSFDKDFSKRALPIALNNLTLKAWDAYTTARGTSTREEPNFIKMLRQRQQQACTKTTNAAEQPLPQAWESRGSSNPNTVQEFLGEDNEEAFDWAAFNASLNPPDDVPDLMSFEFPAQMTWTTLDDLLMDFHETSGPSNEPHAFESKIK